jgi:hypothetical protein
MSNAWRLLLICPCLLVVSCSGSNGLYPVEGKILYGPEQEPIEGAVVVFTSLENDSLSAQRPSGMTNKDGVFTLATGREIGAPPGEYAVTVVLPEKLKPKPGSDQITTGPDESGPGDVFKGRYANPKGAPAKRTIQAGENKLETIVLPK